MSEERISRRRYLKYVAAGAVVVAGAATGAYYFTRPTVTAPATVATSTEVTAPTIGAFTEHKKVGGTVRFITWQEWGADWVVEKCKEEIGVDLKPTFIAENDEGLAKVVAAPDQYDVHLFDHPYTPKLYRGGFLQPFPDELVEFIDKSRFDPFKRKWYNYFDGKMWAATGMWGPQLIVYNADKVPEKDVESWSVMYEDPWHGAPNPYKGYISQMDGPLQVISSTALYLGLGGPSEGRDVDPFVLDSEQLQQIKEVLIKSKPLIRTLFSGTSDVVTAMGLGEIQICNGFGSITQYARMDAKVNAKQIFPREGVGYWVDNITINKTCKDLQAATAFIEWITDAPMAYLVMKDNFCPTTTKGVDLSKDPELKAVTLYGDPIPSNAVEWKDIPNYEEWVRVFDEFKAA